MFEINDLHNVMIHRRRQMPTVNQAGEDHPAGHPAPHAPRIFADSATIQDIRPLVESGIINGVTTNPTLLKKAGAENWDQAKRIMADILKLLHPGPVSVELTKTSADEMIEQARELHALGPDNAIVKVPIGGYGELDDRNDSHTGLKVIRALWERGIRTNATLVFNTTQAFWAANAGATYVSPFMGRLADYLYKNDHPERPPGNALYHLEEHKNPQGNQHVFNSAYVACGGTRKDAGIRLIREVAAVFVNYDIRTEILAASVRNAVQLTEALLAGADILTVPADVLTGVADHPLSNEGMKRFDEDAKTFSG